MKNLNFFDAKMISLIESNSSGDSWKVMIIEQGLSKNGKFYTEEALKTAIPHFEKSKVCFYEWKDKHFDHIPLSIEKIRPEGFPLQTAGFLENVKYETVNIEGRDITGLTGHLKLLETEPVKKLREMIVSAWKKGMKNLLGLSINAEGPSFVRMMNGVPISVVTGIKRVFSTDFVSQPAAGGGLLKLVESINEQQGGNNQMFKKLLEALKQWKPKIVESLDIANTTEDEVKGLFASIAKEAEETKNKKADKINKMNGLVKEGKFDEAEKVLRELMEGEGELSDEELMKANDADLTPEQIEKKKKLIAEKEEGGGDPDEAAKAEEAKKKQEELEKKNKDLESRFNAMETRAKINECKEMLKIALDESKLPEPIRMKIQKSFEGTVFTESKMKESIKIERDTLAKLVESNMDFDLGDISGGFVEKEPVDRLQASLDLMFGYTPEKDDKDYEGVDAFSSLREAYVRYTDDPSISGMLGPKAMSRIQEATEATFTYALGYSMQRRMLPAYKEVEPMWKKLASPTNVKDFKLQERILWGGFGIIPEVQAARTAAGTPIDSATPTYPELGFPSDQESTYAVATKGGIVTLTRRMIIDDDLKILKDIPKKIGRAAALTLNRFVFDLLMNVSAGSINGGTIYDGIALYNAAHKNYRTGVLSHDNLYDLLNDMYYQCEFGNSTVTVAGGDIDSSAAGTDCDVTPGTGQYFKAGDLIWIEGEICSVDSVATDALTITRGLYGTTAATHADGSTVYKVTQIIGIENPTLWVPRGLRSTALALKNSEKNPESAEGAANTVRDLFDPVVCPYLRGDENNYYLSAKPQDIEGMEIGFLNGKQEPEILVQDQPTVGNVFVYDTIRYKVRHEYGGTITDFRAFAGGIVS